MVNYGQDPHIVAATDAHAGYIAQNVRDPDRDEIWAACMMKPIEAMIRGLERSEITCTGMVGGVPVCMWGVVSESFIGPIGIPWMVGTHDLDNVAMKFLRRCRDEVKLMFEGYDMLVNYVDARNKRSIEWLRWLGFEIGEPEPYGLLKLPFHRFSMRR